MHPCHAQQSWRPNPPPRQTRTYFSIPPGNIDSTVIPQHPSHAASTTTSAQHLPQRPKLRTNSPYNKLWACDDFNRGNTSNCSASRGKNFVCYMCQGYLNPGKSCSRCGTNNAKMFVWLGSQNGGYEEMKADKGEDEDVVAYMHEQARLNDGVVYGMKSDYIVFDDTGRERTAVEFDFDDVEEGESPIINLPRSRPILVEGSCLKLGSERSGDPAYTEAMKHVMEDPKYN